MERIKSQLQTNSSEYRDNQKLFLHRLKEVSDRFLSIIPDPSNSAVRKHIARGKLLARERIDLLIDPSSPFIELSAFAAFNQYDNRFPSAGIITGIGKIQGKEAVIIANDATVKGGTYIPETIKKHLRAQEIALENHLPCVYLVDSGGVFLPEQARVFPDKNDFGRIFYNQATMSALGIPQIAVVMGSCTAGGAYVPAMSDETVMVRNQATVFLGGPPLVKAATGEIVTAEELGGAEIHTSLSGVADHLAENDQDALRICRNIFETFTREKPHSLVRQAVEEPYYDPEELYGLIPADLRKPVPPYEILARIVDGSRFQEFKMRYGGTLITGFAHISGYPIGILINNGILFSEAALKATHFIEICKRRGIPLLFLHNINGFMVGKDYEHRGIAKDGAKMVHAVATANVPKFSVMIGRSFGAGNYAMAGRAFSPNLLFMWPNAEIGVMGGEQAANVLTMVKEEQLTANHQTLAPEDKERMMNEIVKKYSMENSAWYSTSRLWDDGIIDPVHTRGIIAMGIEMSLNRKWDEPMNGIYRM